MTRLAGPTLAAALAVALSAFVPAPALAKAPANDDVAKAQVLKLPADVDGTTASATFDKDTEPPSRCATSELGGSVFYTFTAPADGRVVVSLHAAGKVDAVVDVFRQVRSQLNAVDCDATDPNGNAETDVTVKKGEEYTVRVAQLANSVSGTFTLSVALPQPAARPPGPELPAAGVTATLDRIQNPNDAFSVTMRGGGRYRIHLSGRDDKCTTTAAIYAPGTTSFDSEPVDTVGCDDYVVFTPDPGEGGRYPIRVTANRTTRGPQVFHLQAAPIGADDIAPGIFLRNYARAHGTINGAGVDVYDLYRFDVTKRSELTLRLATSSGGTVNMTLLQSDGHRIGSGSDDEALRRRLKPGRYYASVHAQGNAKGRYTLTRQSRAITTLRTTFGGRRRAHVSPGRTVALGVRLSPALAGPATVRLERFDPNFGWLFERRYKVRVRNGRATIGFRTRAVGRYRARADFAGTRVAAPSASGFATVLVAGPLRQR